MNREDWVMEIVVNRQGIVAVIFWNKKGVQRNG